MVSFRNSQRSRCLIEWRERAGEVVGGGGRIGVNEGLREAAGKDVR